MRKRAFGLAVAVIVGVALVSSSGAATTKAQKVTKINVSTRAAVVHYLRSIHVNPKGAVIQRGARNYAGARCPGSRWTCASTRHTVVQIAKRGGQNRFACRSSKCVVVQLSGVSHGVYIAGRTLASTSAPTKGNSATCIKTGSGATTGSGQSCLITQTSGPGPNSAVVYENTQKMSGLVQSAQYTASITQQSSGSNGNTACVTQNISLDGSTTNTNTKGTTANLQAHQSITINQDATGNGGTNTAKNAAVLSGNTAICDTNNTLAQNQTLSSTITTKGQIIQNEDSSFAPCGDGVTGDYANLCLNIAQNQGSGLTNASSGANDARFTQTSTQTAIAITPNGPVTQTQSTPSCVTTNPPTNPPASCTFPGGLVGTINQKSAASSYANATQVETQCEDAATSNLSSCHTGSGDNDFNGTYGLTQNQYGPVGVGKLRNLHRGSRRVGFSHGKGLGASVQSGGSGNQFVISQTSTQDNDHVAGTQLNTGQADCTSINGSCKADQTTTVNNAPTSDGYTAGSITGLKINCNGQACQATPPPVPSFVSGPTNPNHSSSAAFNFTDTATSEFHFLCKVDGTPQTCQSGVAFFQGYGSHTFQVAAADNHGNVSDYVPASAFTWTNVPPDPTITPSSKPHDPSAFNTSGSFSFTDLDPLVIFKCKLDGAATYTACTSGNVSTNLASGSHSFSVKAYDSTGTVASTNDDHYSWVITPPDPTITSNPDPQTTSTDATFTFGDADSTAKFECKLDAALVYSACPSGTPTYSGLSHGPHTLLVRATDQFGQYESTGNAEYDWEVIPYLTFEVSSPDFGAFADWSGTPGSSPITLTTGTDDGTYAQFTIHDRSNLKVSDLVSAEPSFNTDTYVGAPRYEIDLDNGDYLFGYPPQAGFGSNSWDINCGGTNLSCVPMSFASWAQVQAAEGSATITDALIEADFPTNYTYSIADFTYDNYGPGDVAP